MVATNVQTMQQKDGVKMELLEVHGILVGTGIKDQTVEMPAASVVFVVEGEFIVSSPSNTFGVSNLLPNHLCMYP